MALHFSTGLKNQLFNSIRGATTNVQSLEHGVIFIFPGLQPETADDAALVSPIGVVTVGGGAFVWGSPTNALDFEESAGGILVKATAEIWQFKGLANATAGWFRHCGNAEDALGESSTLPRIDGRIGPGAEMELGSQRVELNVTNTVDVYRLEWPPGF